SRAPRVSHDSPYAMDAMFVTVHRSAAGAAWRWRTELATLIAAAAALWRLTLLFTLTAAAVILVGLVLVVLAVPGSRRFTVRRVWCVLARHRIQRLCWEARLHTRAISAPGGRDAEGNDRAVRARRAPGSCADHCRRRLRARHRRLV